MNRLLRALPLLLALPLAGCAGFGEREAARGAVLVTIDHASGRALPPEATRPDSPEGYTELRYLGVAGAEAVFLETVRGPVPITPAATTPATTPATADEPAPDEPPRESTSLTLDIASERVLPVRGYEVDVEDVTPDRVRYSVRPARGA